MRLEDLGGEQAAAVQTMAEVLRDVQAASAASLAHQDQQAALPDPAERVDGLRSGFVLLMMDVRGPVDRLVGVLPTLRDLARCSGVPAAAEAARMLTASTAVVVGDLDRFAARDEIDHRLAVDVMGGLDSVLLCLHVLATALLTLRDD